MKMTGGDEVKAALRPRSGCANELTKEGLPGLAGRPETGNQTHPRARWRHRLARTLVVIPVMVLGLLNSVPRLTAQTDQEAPTVRYPLPTLLDVQPGLEVERGPHHQVLQTVSRYQQPDGQVLLETNTITVLATGLFHEQDGRLVASSEDLEEVPGGIVGRRGPHQAIFPLELTDPAGVDVLSADKQRFRSRVIGLSYYDAGSGRSVLLAEPQASRAELLAPNRVIYRDAFDDVDADVLFEYRKGSVSQEVVLRGQLPGPEEFGLEGGSTRLEVLTEWLEAPEPVKERRVIPRAVDEIVRAGMAEPDPVDDRLEFGSYLMGPGRVFWVEGVEGGEEPGCLVAKRWDVTDGRTVLFESVDYTAIAGWLDRLGGQASASPPGGGKSKSYAATARPKRAVSGRVLPPRSTARVEPPARARKGRLVASAARSKGLVLDWTLLLSGTNVTLRARETYLVLDTVSLGGTTTVQGGAVVKFTNTLQAKIVCNGPVVCDTAPYRPAVFTAWRDNTVGQTIPTSNGNPFTNYYANPALQIMTNAQVLHDLRVSHAQKGVFFHDYSAGTNSALKHAQLVRCGTAAQFNGNGTVMNHFKLHNVLIYDVGTAIYGYSFTGNVQHVTVNKCSQLAYDYYGTNYGTTSLLNMTNCLLAAVTNTGNVYYSQRSCYWPADGTVFQQAGAGWHYLPAGSPYRNSAFHEVDPDLCKEMAGKTTVAPSVAPSPITASTTLGPRVMRGQGPPNEPPDRPRDIGYYYNAIDLAAGTLVVTNAAILTLKPDLAVATFADLGIRLEGTSRLEAEGTPTRPVRIFRYNVVQEQTTNWGNGTYEPSGIVGPAGPTSVTNAPSASLRFVSFSSLGGYGYNVYTENNWWMLNPLALRDCQFYGGKALIGGATACTLGLTNNLFARVATTFKFRAEVNAYNNLFWQGSNRFDRYVPAATWTFRDNAFHDTDITDVNGGITHSHNAYLGTNQARLQPTSPNDVVLASFTYASRPLGPFYHVTTNLIDKGSRNATNAALFHYTTQTNLAKETNSIVDIGFHYAATTEIDEYSVALDADGDGLADCIEDRNGDGETDAGETYWTYRDTDVDGFKDGEEVSWGTDPTDWDSDDDECNDLIEAKVRGTDPMDRWSYEPVRLSYWRFNTNALTNEAGVAPLEHLNVVLTNSFEGKAPNFTNAGTVLRYPCSADPTNYVSDTNKYVGLRHGAIRFWYMPNWYHGSSNDSPGASCTLLQVGGWRLSVSADGRYVVFETPTPSGWTNETLRVLLPRSGETNFSGRKGWEIALNYTRATSWIMFNGAMAPGDCSYSPSFGTGVQALPAPDAIQQGLYVGGSLGGANSAQGLIDELETFNAPVGHTELWDYFGPPFARLWDNQERRRELMVASVPAGQNQIDLRWVRGFEGDPELCLTNYALHRRAWGQTNWALLSNVLWDRYSDASASNGAMYEYRVNRLTDSVTNVAALRAAPEHHRGRVLLLVDGTLASSLTTNIVQFQEDLRADGWSVFLSTNMPRHDHTWAISSNTYKSNLSVVKQAISNQWNQYKSTESNIVALLLGHVTIPYSGNTAEDGHTDHSGAWPAETYYGDVDGVWTDRTVTNTNPNLPLRNMPDDGKWDQDEFPPNSAGAKELEVAVGRIDFVSMPPFGDAAYLTDFGMTLGTTNYGEIELALIRNYLSKDHKYRTNGQAYTKTSRCYLYDNRFQPHIKNLRSTFSKLDGNIDVNFMVGSEEIVNRDVFVETNYYDGVYLWGIHGGYGTFNSIKRSGDLKRYSEQFPYPTNQPPVFFYILAGSYFADWMCGYPPEYTNGLMRACLGTRDYGLASMWSLTVGSLPQSGPWRMDRLALGRPLGTSLQDTIRCNSGQSCRTLYLMGDPTLTCYVLKPPLNLSSTDSVQGTNRTVTLWWTPPAGQTVDGYFVYRAASTNLESVLGSGPLNGLAIAATNYIDTVPANLTNTYAVRAALLTHTGAGSFTNLSQAIRIQVP